MDGNPASGRRGLWRKWIRTNQELARLGREAQYARTRNSPLLPDGVHKASMAIEHLADVAGASNAFSSLEANARAVTDQLAGIAGAGKQHEEALDDTVKKLQELAKTAGQEFEGQAILTEAIAQIAEVHDDSRQIHRESEGHRTGDSADQ